MIDYTLAKGAHDSREEGMCAMEWVAYLANEPHTDSPVCVCPALQHFSMGINDRLPDDLRQQLRPYLARCIGTRSDGRRQERLYMMADWAVRTVAPLALDAAAGEEQAERLRALPPVVDRATAEVARAAGREVRGHVTGLAAKATARATASAYAAASANAADASASAASAAYAAASANAAKRATWETLLPTVLDLYDRMLPTETVAIPANVAGDYRRLLEATAC